MIINIFSSIVLFLTNKFTAFIPVLYNKRKYDITSKICSKTSGILNKHPTIPNSTPINKVIILYFFD